MGIGCSAMQIQNRHRDSPWLKGGVRHPAVHPQLSLAPAGSRRCPDVRIQPREAGGGASAGYTFRSTHRQWHGSVVAR